MTVLLAGALAGLIMSAIKHFDDIVAQRRSTTVGRALIETAGITICSALILELLVNHIML